MTFVSNGTVTLTDAEMRAISDESAALRARVAELEHQISESCDEARHDPEQHPCPLGAKLAAVERDADRYLCMHDMDDSDLLRMFASGKAYWDAILDAAREEPHSGGEGEQS